MRKLNVYSLRAGMKLGRPIFGDKGDILLNTGAILSDKYIKNLVKMGILDVYIDEGLLPDTVLDDVISWETRSLAVRQIKRIMTESREKGKLVIDPKPLYYTVNDIVSQLLASEKVLYNLIDLRTQDDYTFQHSVNVCVLALLTGISLNFTRDRLVTLGIGSLLHDLGKIKIPNEILNKPGKLNEREFSIIKEHTSHGHNLLRAVDLIGELPANIAYQHHENYDGSGYPNGLSGNEISAYAQITAVADRFDALTANRPYRQAYPPHEAYEMCSGAGNYLFDETFITAFLYNIAAYPTGTLVELNNRMIGVVTETVRGYSLFPKVKVLMTRDLSPIHSQFEVPLAERKEFSITRVFGEEESRLILDNSK